MCRIIMSIGDKNYADRQSQYTLLRKEKKNLQTGELILQYDHMTSKIT